MSVLAVDIGSSRTKVLLADWDGRLGELRSAATPRSRAGSGAWSFPVEDVARVVDDLILATTAAHHGAPVDTLVFSCLGTAMAPVAADGQPLGRALAPYDAWPPNDRLRLRERGLSDDELARRSGSDPAAPSSLQHLLWWSTQHPEIIERAHRFRSLRGFIASRLGEVDAEDRSWASRTMLYDLETAEWSDEVVAAANVPAELLPPLASSTASYPLHAAVVERLSLAPGARLVLGAMDNCCSFFGAAGADRSGLVNIVGTFEHLAGTGTLDTARQVAELAPVVIHAYLFEHQHIVMTRMPLGSLLARVVEDSKTNLEALLDALSPQPTGLVVEPTLEAVDAALRAGRERIDVLQGLLQAAAGTLVAFADAWAGMGLPHEPIAVVGGGADHPVLLQLKASVLRRALVRLAVDEAAAVGALRLAATAVKGATPAEACSLFENPVARTIGPATRPLAERSAEVLSP